MLMNSERPELEAEIRAARTFEALEAVLGKVLALIERFKDPENFGLRLFSQGLDNLIPYIAQLMHLEATPPPKSNADVCIIATNFYTTGGHTRVGQDIARLLPPDQRPLMIMTNTGGANLRYRDAPSRPGLQTDFRERAFLLLHAPTLVEKIVELFQMLKAARASRIILLCHPFDVVAIVATWPFRDVVEFVHHVDHTPALGATLPFSAHVDLTYTCHRACREAGLNAVFASMTSAVVDAPPRGRAPGRLRFATCADERKYAGRRRHGWIDYAVAAMRLPGAEFVHIGGASEGMQTEIRQALSAAGLDPARYVFVGQKDSLPAELVASQPDVYLGSYPIGGGKAALEAMLAGVPVISPCDPDAPRLLRFALPLPHYIDIESPDELEDAVTRALALGEAMRTPEGLAARDLEIGRFGDFVAGRPLSAA